MTRHLAVRPLFYLTLLALAIFYLLPVYLMVLTGLKPFSEVDLKTMWNLPTDFRIENFIAGYKQLAPNLRNSLLW